MQFHNGDVILLYFKINGKSQALRRGVYIQPNRVVWVSDAGIITQSSFSRFTDGGTGIVLDLLYQNSSSKFKGDDVERRALSKLGNKWVFGNETFIQWCVNDVIPVKSTWSNIVLGATLGFYVGGFTGAALGGFIGYKF